ncbi:MAG: hypothetical protein IJY15_06030, partial [Thermoguttaceae bacterium]|nr:hypothetical protein [Thermoguttaceae bacterium]
RDGGGERSGENRDAFSRDYGASAARFAQIDEDRLLEQLKATTPAVARRGIARPPCQTSTSKTISPVGVRVERGASFAAVRFRVAPFGVSSVVSFRAFLGQSHPFVFRSRLQSQGVRFGVKTRRSVKIGARRSDADAGTLRPNANAPKKDALAVSARRIKRNIRRRF